jgi:hypothetical protein
MIFFYIFLGMCIGFWISLLILQWFIKNWSKKGKLFFMDTDGKWYPKNPRT